MSSVIAVLAENEILVATDTLCYPLGDSDCPALSFMTKAFYLPHLNLLATGSGSGGFLEHWIDVLHRGHTLWPGIEGLAHGCQQGLDLAWSRWKAQNPRPAGEEQDQAVYYFGVSEETGEMVGFTLVSWDGFTPKEHSFRVNKHMSVFAKPLCSEPVASSMAELPAAFFRMMQEQRANQIANVYDPHGNGRASIGGEMVIHHLSAAGCVIYKAGRFEDYDVISRKLWPERYACRLREVC